MTGTEIRDALLDVALAVDVPAPDRLGFERLVRAERRQRRVRLGLALGACAAAAAVVGGLVLTGLPGGDQTPSKPPVAEGTDDPVAVPMGPVPVLLNGQMSWFWGSGIGGNGNPAASVLGSVQSGDALLLDAQKRVWLERAPGGEGGEVRLERLGANPVRAAVLDKTGSWLTFVDAEGTVHVRDTSYDYDVATATGGIDGELLAGNGVEWLMLKDGEVTVEGPDDPVTLDAGEDALGAQMGGNMVAVQTISGASFFELESGDRLQLDLGGAVGGLSSDGSWYATAATASQRTNGMSPNLNLVETRSGDMHSVHGFDSSQQVLSVWWQGDNRFLVLSRAGNGDRVLWSCYQSRDECFKGYVDPTRTLALAEQ